MSRKSCIVSINDQTFETWVTKQTELSRTQQDELLVLYTQWQDLNKTYTDMEYTYLIDPTTTQQHTKKRRKTKG
jgi:hypothetical protein